MKKVILFFAAALMISTSVMAQRQQMTQEQIAQRQAERIQQQTERMVKELGLKDDEKSEFESIYKEYQKELLEAMGQDQRRQREEDKRADQMTSEECYKKIKDNLDQMQKQVEQAQKRLDITKKYMAQLMPILNAQQMYKVFGQRQQGWGGQNGQNGQQRNWNGQGGQGGYGGQRGGQGGYGGGQRGGFGGGF